MGGDVTGMSNACTVVGFGTYPIQLTAPAVGDAWQWDGAEWIHVQQPIVFLVPTVPSTTITSNRSANQSPTTPGVVGGTNLGSGTGGVGSDYATVIGGLDCSASAEYATAIGGNANTASGTIATCVGGQSNVASDLDSACVGGQSNTASASWATCIGGNSNAASNANAATVGGSFLIASGISSAAVGGTSNTASGSLSVVLGGTSSTATVSSSAVLGGIGASPRLATSQAHAGGQTEAAGVGNRQWQRVVLRGDTPGAVPAETVDLGSGGYGVSPTATAFALLDDRAYLVTVRAAGVRATGAGRSLEVHAFVRRLAGVVDVVAQHVALSIGDPACCLYDVEVVASGGNMIVRATTGAGNTHATRWVGSVEWEEVRFV